MVAIILILETAILAAVLYWTIARRVHIHIEYTSSSPSPRQRTGENGRKRNLRCAAPVSTSAQSRAGRQRGFKPDTGEKGEGEASPLIADLQSALVHLGTPASQARIAAQRAAAHGYAEFEQSLRRAIDYAKVAA